MVSSNEKAALERQVARLKAQQIANLALDLVADLDRADELVKEEEQDGAQHG